MKLAKIARANVLTLATAYGRIHKLTIEQVSKKLYGSSAFVRNFADEECSASVDKIDWMIQRFSNHWPPESPWPHLAAPDMSRPLPTGKYYPMKAADLAKSGQIT